MMEVVGGGGVMGAEHQGAAAGQVEVSGEEQDQVESAAARLLEEIRQELRSQSEECHYPYDNRGIKERYQDTAHIIYRKSNLKNDNYLSFGTRRSSSVSQYGNTPLVLRKSKSSLEQWPSYHSRFGSSSTLADNDDVCDSVAATPKIKKDGNKSRGQQRCLQETNLDDIIDEDYDDGADSGIQVHSRCENRKSFSQYDIHISRNKDESLQFLANTSRKDESIDTIDAEMDDNVLEENEKREDIGKNIVKRKENGENANFNEKDEKKSEVDNNEFKIRGENNETPQNTKESQIFKDFEINKERKEAENLIEDMVEYTKAVTESEKTEEHIVDEIVEEKFRDSIRKRKDGVKVTTVEGMADQNTRYKLQVGMIGEEKNKDENETKEIIAEKDGEKTVISNTSEKDGEGVISNSAEKDGAEGVISNKVSTDVEVTLIKKHSDNGAKNLVVEETTSLVDKSLEEDIKQIDKNMSAYNGAYSEDVEIVDIQEISKVDIKGCSELSSTTENNDKKENTSNHLGNVKHKIPGKIIEAIDPIVVMRKEKFNVNSNEEQNKDLCEIFDESKIVDSSVGNIIEGRLVVEVKGAPKYSKDEPHQIINKENVAPVNSHKDIALVNELVIIEDCDVNHTDEVKDELHKNRNDRKSILGPEESGRNCIYNSNNEKTFINEIQININEIPRLDSKVVHLSSFDHNNRENVKNLGLQNSSDITPVGSCSPNLPVKTKTDLYISDAEALSSNISTSPKPPKRKHKGHSSLPTSPVLSPKSKGTAIQNLNITQNSLDNISRSKNMIINDTTDCITESENKMHISSSYRKGNGSADPLSVNVSPVEELNTSFEPEPHNMLVKLPMRSPTPPKRSPRNSPRLARHKEASEKKRPVSLILPRDTKDPSFSEPSHHEPGLKASVSLSPTSIRKRTSAMFAFPYFSLRKEKSKSSDQMLASKQDKEKSKSSVSLTGGSKLTDSETSKFVKQEVAAIIHDGQTDTRRVGTRSMLIDGTIKRNFIVIHPLDDSETLGLAPVSPHTKHSESYTIPKALESVKSKVSGAIGSRFDSLRKKSMKKNEEQIHLDVDHFDESKLSASTSNQSLQNSHSKIEKNKDNKITSLMEVSSVVPESKVQSIDKNHIGNVTREAEGPQETSKCKLGQVETGMQNVADLTPIYKTTLDPGQNLPLIIPEITPLVGEPSGEQQPSVVVRSAPCGGDISVIEDQAVIEDQVVSGHHGLHVTNSNNTTSKLCVVM